ncbi:hypothetical protein ACFL2O_08670 [Thermodesulfobacteriota bacterium]
MMEKDHVQEKIMNALISVYGDRERATVGDGWQGRVMASIRRLNDVKPRLAFLDAFEGLVWRFAPVAAVLIVLLTVGIGQLDFFSDFELAKILSFESADFSLPPLLES